MNEKCWFPTESETTINEDGSLTIQAPQNWIYAGYSGTKLALATDGSTHISCTCNTSGSCLPFVADGPGGHTAGCAGDCTNCTMKQSLSHNGVTINKGGYLNLNDNPKIIIMGDSLPAAFGAMFDLPEVQQKIADYVNQLYPDKKYPVITEKDGQFQVPDGFLFAAINLCGRAVIMPIPEADMVANGAGGNNASCECTNGTCTPKSHSVPFVGTVISCEGDCQGTCTLTLSSIHSGHTEVTYKAEVYTF